MNTPQLPSEYRFDEQGLSLTKSDQVLANCFIAPKKVYCLTDGGQPIFCDVVIVRPNGYQLLQARMPLATLTPKWWKALPPGCCYAPEARVPHRHMAALFHRLLEKLEPVTIFQPDTLGWNTSPTGERVFVTGNGALGSKGYLSADQVWIPNSMQRFQLETLHGATEEAAAGYFRSLYSVVPGITDTLLANALAAILYPCFKEARVDSRFLLILEGPSEAKKTTLACLTSCLYNRATDLRSTVASLTSTGRALERRGIELRHTPLIVDDLFPDGGSALEHRAMELVRAVANQLPRESCSGKALDGSVLECGVVITAEAFPKCEKSTRTRCLRLKLSEPIHNSLLAPLQEHPELLGNVFERFIVYVAGHFDEIVHQIEEDFRTYRESRANPDAHPVSSERLYVIGFVLYTALKIFLENCELDSSQVSETLANFNKRLGRCIDWQLSPQASPGQGWLIAAIATVVKQRPDTFTHRSGYVCITPQNLCLLLRQYCGDERITVSDITWQLRNAGLLSMDKSGVATRKIKDKDGQSRRYLYIDKRRLPQL